MLESLFKMKKYVIVVNLLFLISLFEWMNASSLLSFANMPKMPDSYAFGTLCWCPFCVHLAYMSYTFCT